MGDELAGPAPPAGPQPDDAAQRPIEDEPTTEQLRAIQARRVGEEAERAQEAEDAEAQRAHERRAERAAYLRDRLTEQAEADADA